MWIYAHLMFKFKILCEDLDEEAATGELLDLFLILK